MACFDDTKVTSQLIESEGTGNWIEFGGKKTRITQTKNKGKNFFCEI